MSEKSSDFRVSLGSVLIFVGLLAFCFAMNGKYDYRRPRLEDVTQTVPAAQGWPLSFVVYRMTNSKLGGERFNYPAAAVANMLFAILFSILGTWIILHLWAKSSKQQRILFGVLLFGFAVLNIRPFFDVAPLNARQEAVLMQQGFPFAYATAATTVATGEATGLIADGWPFSDLDFVHVHHPPRLVANFGYCAMLAVVLARLFGLAFVPLQKDTVASELDEIESQFNVPAK